MSTDSRHYQSLRQGASRALTSTQGPDAGSTPAAGAPKKFGAESTYNKEDNTIQYSTIAHFPAVRLLPNAERKRILGKCSCSNRYMSHKRRVSRRRSELRSQSLVAPVLLDRTWLTD